jgi:hypothetical protein
LAIAKGLGAFDVAMNEVKVLRIPAKIFAIDHAVFHRQILAMPEGVFGMKFGVENFTAFHILKGILPVQREVIDVDVPIFEKGIFAHEGAVLNGDMGIPPKELG